MDIFETIHGLPVLASILLAITVSFVLLALVNYSIALFVERRRPPTGRFIEVNGRESSRRLWPCGHGRSARAPWTALPWFRTRAG
jgi:hypothetical protein